GSRGYPRRRRKPPGDAWAGRAPRRIESKVSGCRIFSPSHRPSRGEGGARGKKCWCEEERGAARKSGPGSDIGGPSVAALTVRAAKGRRRKIRTGLDKSVYIEGTVSK